MWCTPAKRRPRGGSSGGGRRSGQYRHTEISAGIPTRQSALAPHRSRLPRHPDPDVYLHDTRLRLGIAVPHMGADVGDVFDKLYPSCMLLPVMQHLLKAHTHLRPLTRTPQRACRASRAQSDLQARLHVDAHLCGGCHGDARPVGTRARREQLASPIEGQRNRRGLVGRLLCHGGAATKPKRCGGRGIVGEAHRRGSTFWVLNWFWSGLLRRS